MPLLVIVGLALIPFLDREQKFLGIWFTDSTGKKWALIGLIWGIISTTICVFLGVNVPVRELFPNIESALFFELVNPAILLLLTFIALYFVTLKFSKSTRTAAIATFSAFVISFIMLTYTGTVLRGPNWLFFWPWESWPIHPILY